MKRTGDPALNPMANYKKLAINHSSMIQITADHCERIYGNNHKARANKANIASLLQNIDPYSVVQEGIYTGMTSLWIAVELNLYFVYNYLIDNHPRIDINATCTEHRKYKGISVLWNAVHRKNLYLVTNLVKIGASVNATSLGVKSEHEGKSILELAIRIHLIHKASHTKELISLLIRHGANIHALCSKRCSISGKSYAEKPILELLKDVGYDCSYLSQDINNNTNAAPQQVPALRAIDSRDASSMLIKSTNAIHIEHVRELLHAVDPASVIEHGEHQGLNPFWFAVRNDLTDIALDFINNPKVNIDAVATIDTVYKGVSPLWLAVKNGNNALATALINRGANIHATCTAICGYNRWKSVLDLAVERQNWEITKLLVEGGCRASLELLQRLDYPYLHPINTTPLNPAQNNNNATVSTNSPSLIQPVPIETTQSVTAHIPDQYIGGHVPALPVHAPEYYSIESNIIAKNLNNTLELSTLSNLSTNHSPTIYHTEIPYSQAKLHWISRKAAQNTDKPIFVLTCNNENSRVPSVESNNCTRVILVVTIDEYYRTYRNNFPNNLDLLVIQQLISNTHGAMTDLATINSRRIAAFICAMHLNKIYAMQTAIMLDDNLKSISFKDLTSNNTWDNLQDKLTDKMQQENTVCLSVPAISYKLQKSSPSNLGSKLFLLDLNAIQNSILGQHPDGCFLPFYPSAHGNLVLEDYFMQIMLQHIFPSQRAYLVAPYDEFGLTKQPKLKKTIKPQNALANDILNVNFCDSTIIANNLDFSSYISESLAYLKKIIQENLDNRAQKLRLVTDANLAVEHAKANGLPISLRPILAGLQVEPVNFLQAYKEQLNTFISSQIEHFTPSGMRKYQKAALQLVIEKLSDPNALFMNNLFGKFTKATGTGKTIFQIYLAMLALLTGTKRPIIIVTPTKNLVNQFYNDFVDVLKTIQIIDIGYVIKVDSDIEAVHLDTLKINKPLKQQQKIIIICNASYQKMMEWEEDNHYLNPCMLFLDESHTINFRKMNNPTTNKTDMFIASFSATPKDTIEQISNNNFFEYTYTRQAAVADGFLAPLILKTFNCKYSKANVQDKIDNMSILLKTHRHPNGGFLSEYHGIIYVPNNRNSYSYSKDLSNNLDKAQIGNYEIDSDNPRCLQELQLFKNNTDSSRKILICKGMGRLGLSYNEIHWVIYLRKGNDPLDVCQVAGRTVRLKPGKIGYMLGFNGIKTELLEGTFDRQAKELLHPDYIEQSKNDASIFTTTKVGEVTPSPVVPQSKIVNHNVTINNMFFSYNAPSPANQTADIANYYKNIENSINPLDCPTLPDDVYGQPIKNGWTLLHEAILQNNFMWVKFLVGDKQVNLDIADDFKRNIFHVAAKNCTDLSIVQYLTENISPNLKSKLINARDNNDRTPRIVATQYQNTDMIKYFEFRAAAGKCPGLVFNP